MQVIALHRCMVSPHIGSAGHRQMSILQRLQQQHVELRVEAVNEQHINRLPLVYSLRSSRSLSRTPGAKDFSIRQRYSGSWQRACTIPAATHSSDAQKSVWLRSVPKSGCSWKARMNRPFSKLIGKVTLQLHKTSKAAASI